MGRIHSFNRSKTKFRKVVSQFRYGDVGGKKELQNETERCDTLGPCSPEMKKEVVAIINELVAAGDKIPMKMEQNLNTLYAQLA